MRELVFVGFSMLSLSVISGNVHGMFHFFDDRENLSGSSDQIRIRDFDKPREEINGRPTCIGGRRDEYEDLFGKFEDQMLCLVKQSESSVREIVKLQEENWILRHANKHPDDNSEWIQYSTSQEFDAIKTFIETFQGAVGVFSKCIAEFSEKLENLRKQNEALKKENVGTSESDEQ